VRVERQGDDRSVTGECTRLRNDRLMTTVNPIEDPDDCDPSSHVGSLLVNRESRSPASRASTMSPLDLFPPSTTVVP
jgi:hypothetical protein